MPAAAAVAVVAASAYSANRQASAAKKAASAQERAANAGIDEQRRQFDATQELLRPWVTAGASALGRQGDIVGLNGTEAQAAAIQALQSSPQFAALLRQGENSILSNSSATGGLRGGNTQGALAQFSPALLSATINDQYTRLGGLSQQGFAAAGQTGQFGQAATNNVTSLLGQIGQSQAGNALAQGRAQAEYANAIAKGFSAYYGGVGGGVQPGPYYAAPPSTYSPYSLAGSNVRFGGGF